MKRKLNIGRLLLFIGCIIACLAILGFLVVNIHQFILQSQITIKFKDEITTVEVLDSTFKTSDAVESSSGAVTYPTLSTDKTGEFQVIYTVTDENQNTKEFEHTIKVIDSIPPTVNINSRVVFIQQQDYDLSLNLIGDSQDQYDGLIETEITGEIKELPGVYVVSYSATDSSGNKSVEEVYYLYNITPETILEPFMIDEVIVVNHKIPLPKDYDPGRSIEADQLMRSLIDAGKEEGYHFIEKASYRSYDTQQQIYDLEKPNYTIHEFEMYVAKPGYSEYQTGLTFSITDGSTDFSNSPAYQWLIDNCAEYGFILRYPEGKEDITGFAYDPTTLRYVGAKIAPEIMESNLTLEEYLNID